MSDLEWIDAASHVTGEDAHEIQRRGFVLTGPEDSGSNPEPECLLDVMLVDLPESGTVDWDAVLGNGGFQSPFYTRAQMARRKAKARVKPNEKQVARAATGRRVGGGLGGDSKKWPGLYNAQGFRDWTVTRRRPAGRQLSGHMRSDGGPTSPMASLRKTPRTLPCARGETFLVVQRLVVL